MNGCMVTHGVLSAINLLLLLIVTVSPFWMVCHHNTGDVHMGLWFSCPKERCGYLAIKTASLNVAQGMAIIGLGSCLFALMSSMRILPHLMKWKISENLISSVANFITGFCMLSTAVIMHFRLRLLTDAGITPLVPNWAFFLSGVICFLSFMLGVLSLVWYQLLDSAQQRLGTQRGPVQVKEPTLVDFMESSL
ncbi:uncharacterized protein LOC143838993 [Paroedura picta]|uniref:uncharacterized protein LOC143838993 n=1 Tax=Paroedura picta TaxID=143630 RepID=UPI00405607E2